MKIRPADNRPVSASMRQSFRDAFIRPRSKRNAFDGLERLCASPAVAEEHRHRSATLLVDKQPAFSIRDLHLIIKQAQEQHDRERRCKHAEAVCWYVAPAADRGPRRFLRLAYVQCVGCGQRSIVTLCEAADAMEPVNDYIASLIPGRRRHK